MVKNACDRRLNMNMTDRSFKIRARIVRLDVVMSSSRVGAIVFDLSRIGQIKTIGTGR